MHAGVDGFAVALVGIEAVPTIVIGVSSARAASRAVARIPYVAEGLATGDLTRSTGITLPGETGLFAAANADVAAGSQATSEHAGYVAAGAERMSAAIREIAATADQAAKVAETGRDGQSVNPSIRQSVSGPTRAWRMIVASRSGPTPMAEIRVPLIFSR